MKKTLLILGAAAALAACTQQKTNDEAAATSLILYYSQSGATQQVAELIQQKVGADIEALQVTNPYNGDFAQTIARCQEEMAAGTTPELQPLTHNIADYDTIYIGYPVWFGTYAMPIATLVKENDFAGKVIIPFCTFGSGGNTSITALKEALPNAKAMLPYYGVRNARIAKAGEELDVYLNDIVAGKADTEKCAAFSDPQALTDADKAIFDEACGSYQMPLGTPVTVANRQVNDATEYLFKVESAGTDGQVQQAEIYVLKGNAEGAVAEFTQVVR